MERWGSLTAFLSIPTHFWGPPSTQLCQPVDTFLGCSFHRYPQHSQYPIILIWASFGKTFYFANTFWRHLQLVIFAHPSLKDKGYSKFQGSYFHTFEACLNSSPSRPYCFVFFPMFSPWAPISSFMNSLFEHGFCSTLFWHL